MTMMIEGDVVRWVGEMLWPEHLELAPIVDLSAVTLLGSWVHALFRAYGQCRVVGASPAVRQQLEQAGLPILWYRTVSEASASGHGVSPSERAMLWS